MRCPKCGFEQTPAAACGRCGVLFDRLRDRPQKRPSTVIAPPPRARAPLPWDLGLGGLALLALGLWLWTRAGPPPAPPKSASSPPQVASRGAPRSVPGAGVSAFPAAPAVPSGAPTPPPMPPVTARCPIAGAVEPSGYRQVPPYWLTGASGYEDAVRQRQASAAPLVVYFFTDWCRYCKEIDRELFSSAEVDRYFSRAVFRVRVNPEAGEAERRLADRFNVTGFPSFFVLPASSEEPLRCSLYGEGDERKPASPRQLQDRIERENLRIAKRLIHEAYELRRAGDPAGAVKLLDRAVSAAPQEPDGWLQRALAREGQDALDEALDDYGMVAVLRKDGIAHDRAVHVLLQARRFDEAVACATEWMQREPQDIRPIRQRSRAHQQRGDVARAREDAERCCALGDEEACAVAGRG